MKELVDLEEEIIKYSGDNLLNCCTGQTDGFSDRYLGRLLQISEEIRERRIN